MAIQLPPIQIRTEHGLRLIADMDIPTCDQHLDLLLVPGGPGQLPLMEAEAVLVFIRQWALNINPERGRFFLTSVCTGALVLAATGLLVPLPPLNRRVQATTHWLFRPLLEALGVELRDGRSVWCDVATRVDGNERAFTLVTGGGITAGIDFALDVVARLYGTKVAQGIQLAMEVRWRLCYTWVNLSTLPTRPRLTATHKNPRHTHSTTRRRPRP